MKRTREPEWRPPDKRYRENQLIKRTRDWTTGVSAERLEQMLAMLIRLGLTDKYPKKQDSENERGNPTRHHHPSKHSPRK